MDIYKQKIKLTVQDKDPLYYANIKIYHFKEVNNVKTIQIRNKDKFELNIVLSSNTLLQQNCLVNK